MAVEVHLRLSERPLQSPFPVPLLPLRVTTSNDGDDVTVDEWMYRNDGHLERSDRSVALLHDHHTKNMSRIDHWRARRILNDVLDTLSDAAGDDGGDGGDDVPPAGSKRHRAFFQELYFTCEHEQEKREQIQNWSV